jgi:hypothetical protein
MKSAAFHVWGRSTFSPLWRAGPQRIIPVERVGVKSHPLFMDVTSLADTIEEREQRIADKATACSNLFISDNFDF